MDRVAPVDGRRRRWGRGFAGHEGMGDHHVTDHHVLDGRDAAPRGSIVERFAPGIDHLRRYERRWLRGDVVAGVTVAAYMIPQVMAMAVVAGLEPVVGLYAIIGALVVYTVLGSSPQLSCGPDSTSALMTAAAVAPLAAGDPERYAVLATGLAVVVALICLVAWAARLGFLTDLLSKPVLVGYMAGVAAIMISGQLGKLTKVEVDGDAFVAEVRSFGEGIGDVHGPTLALGAGVLAFLLVASRLFPKLPVPLLGILVATAAAVVLSLEDHGVQSIGQIPSGLPVPKAPDLALRDLTALLLPAFGVTIVAYSDNVLVGRGFAARNGYRIDTNQEFLALGGANLGSAAMGGFPVSSSASRTVIGDAMGSRSQVYSLVALATVIPTLLFLRPVLARFPTAALGALVVYAALRLVDVAEFRRIGRFRQSELVLALATTVGVLVFGVLYGVLLAVARLDPRPAAPGGEAPRRHPRIRPRRRRHARHRRLPGRPAGSGPRRLPLRLADVLRQRRRLPAAGPGVSRRGGRASRVVRAERRGERARRHHLGGRLGRATGGAGEARRGLRLGPGETGPQGRPERRRLPRAHRRGPHLPDAADRRARLRPVVHRAPRIPTAGRQDPHVALG